MNTPYAALKHHFDKLLFGGYPQNTGLEPIRDVFQRAFNKPINIFDVYSTRLSIPTNQISEMISLIGPTDEDETEEPLDLGYPSGIMPGTGNVVYVDIFDSDIFKGLSGKEARYYAAQVHDSMLDIIMQDRFYPSKWQRKKQPYCEFIKGLPLYLSFNHIRDCVPCVLEDDKTFKDIIEKYYVADENTMKLYDSLMNNPYSEEVEDIIKTLTCNNTIEFFHY